MGALPQIKEYSIGVSDHMLVDWIIDMHVDVRNAGSCVLYEGESTSLL